MKKTVWQVWKEDENGNETEVLFTGSKTNAMKYYKKNGGSKAGLHKGYFYYKIVNLFKILLVDK